MVRHPSLTLRRPISTDAFALGTLLAQGLCDAPSSIFDPIELNPNALVVGQEIMTLAQEQGHLIQVADLAYELAGVVRATPKEFVRSSHVADVTILVHPRVRRQHIGSALLEAITTKAWRTENICRLSMRIAADDIASQTLLQSSGWLMERHEPDALWRSDQMIAVQTWSLLRET